MTGIHPSAATGRAGSDVETHEEALIRLCTAGDVPHDLP